MSSISGGYFHQSYVTKAASTDINADELAEFFVKKVEGVHAATSIVPHCRRRSPCCISATSVKFKLSSLSAARDDGFGCQKFRSRQEQ